MTAIAVDRIAKLTIRRTHRERKEQYMRALETEVSRLREAYTNEISDANVTIQKQKEMLQSVRDENDILKEILVAHGIQYGDELERRRSERPPVGYRSSPVAASSTGSQTAGFAHSATQQNTTPGTSISTGMSPKVTAVDHPEVSPPVAFAPQQVYHSSPADQIGSLDRSACQMADSPVPAMRGVFETDPQLQVDFILTYVIGLLPSEHQLTIHSTPDWKDPAVNTQTISAAAQ